MPSVFTHPVLPAALFAGIFPAEKRRFRILAIGLLFSVLPDADAIGFFFGVRYADFWGHRGFTHSLVFAGSASFAVTWFFRDRGNSAFRIFLFLFLSMASHGIADMLTSGGLGVALFSPFDDRRWFFPWRPVPVSPIGTGFFSDRGWLVFRGEILLIWLPALITAGVLFFLRRKRSTES